MSWKIIIRLFHRLTFEEELLSVTAMAMACIVSLQNMKANVIMNFQESQFTGFT